VPGAANNTGGGALAWQGGELKEDPAQVCLPKHDQVALPPDGKRAKGPAQVCLPKHDYVVEAFPSCLMANPHRAFPLPWETLFDRP
jgi:hypothetical protein